MAFNGSGVFLRLYTWVNDAASDIKIRADRMDNEMNGFATGLSTCITKNGQTTITANLPMAGYRHTGVGNALNRTDYAAAGQVQDGKINWADAGGTADAITASYTPTVSALVDGQLFFVRAAAANTSTTPTFNPDSTGDKTITKNGAQALAAGDIYGDGHELALRYRLSDTSFELLNPSVNFTEADVYDPATSGQPTTVDTLQEGIDAAFATFQNGNVLCPHTGLVVKYVSATTVDIDAASVTLFNAAGYGRKFSSLNETLDITASGANGLDTGSEASGTWYYLWAIGKVDGTLDGLISASATAPTLPTGYVFKGLLGAVRNDGSSDFVRFFQTGSVVVTPNDSVLSAGTAISYTSIDLSAYVPPTAISVKLNVGPNSSSGTNVVECRIVPAGSGTTDTYGIAAYTYGTYATIGTSVAAECPMSTAQTVYYRVSGTNARVDINVNGYRYD